MHSFEFRFAKGARRMLALAGITPENSLMTIDDLEVAVRFGGYGMRTRLDNLTGFQMSGPYTWYRAIGLRMALVDSGITFGTNADSGVCVTFAEPIEPVYVFPKRRHPGMTVTVADVPELAGVLSALGVPDGIPIS